MKNIHVLMVLIAFFVNAGMMSSAYADAVQKTEAGKEIVELQPRDFKPAFTRDTVIKLNEIVRRSHAVISQYDEIVKGIRASVKAASPEAKGKVSQIGALAKESKVALSDMMDAVKVLKASGEEYNSAILAGMIDFVQDVEREVSAQQVTLEKILSAA